MGNENRRTAHPCYRLPGIASVSCFSLEDDVLLEERSTVQEEKNLRFTKKVTTPTVRTLCKSSSWPLFDAGVGLGRETLATTSTTVGRAFGMDEHLLQVFTRMQNSRVAIYAHRGFANGETILCELLANRIYNCFCPSGYCGHAGDLWYVRVLPPPDESRRDHVVFTTPYVSLEPGESE